MSVSAYEMMGHFNIFEDRLKNLPVDRKGSRTQNKEVQEASTFLLDLEQVDFSEVEAKDLVPFLDRLNKVRQYVGQMTKGGAFKRFFGSSLTGSRIGTALDNLSKNVKGGLSKEGSKEVLIKMIRKADMENPERELSRLRAAGILTPEIESKIKSAVAGHKTEVLVMLARAVGIQKIYGKTHHVFTHAESSKWLVCPDLIKEAIKLNEPQKKFPQFKFLRTPSKATKGIEQFFKINGAIDSEFREELISADGFLYHNETRESAIYYLSSNSNASNSVDLIKDSCKKILQSLYPDMIQDDLEEYSKEIRKTGGNCLMGNIFVLCIPKEMSPKVQYRAHPRGHRCCCYRESLLQKATPDIDILESCQEGVSDKFTSCSDQPQFRIFAPELKIENGIKTFLLASEPKERKEEKLGVRALVEEISKKYKYRSPLI